MTKEIRKKTDSNQLLANKHLQNIKIAAEIEAKIGELEEKCLQSKQQAEKKQEEYKEEMDKGRRLLAELQQKQSDLKEKEREAENMRIRSDEQKRTISTMAVEAKRIENEIDRNL